jgi:hypothetical protein
MLGHVQESKERFSIEWQDVYKACSKCKKLVRQNASASKIQVKM